MMGCPLPRSKNIEKPLLPGDDVGAGSFWAFQWVNHRMFCRSHIRMAPWHYSYYKIIPPRKWLTIRLSPQILGYPIDNWTYPQCQTSWMSFRSRYLAIEISWKFHQFTSRIFLVQCPPMLHVWNICQHLPPKWPKCRDIFHILDLPWKVRDIFPGKKNNAPGSSLASDQPCCSAGLEEDPEDQADDHQIKGQKTCQGPQLKMD